MRLFWNSSERKKCVFSFYPPIIQSFFWDLASWVTSSEKQDLSGTWVRINTRGTKWSSMLVFKLIATHILQGSKCPFLWFQSRYSYHPIWMILLFFKCALVQLFCRLTEAREDLILNEKYILFAPGRLVNGLAHSLMCIIPWIVRNKIIIWCSALFLRNNWHMSHHHTPDMKSQRWAYRWYHILSPPLETILSGSQQCALQRWAAQMVVLTAGVRTSNKAGRGQRGCRCLKHQFLAAGYKVILDGLITNSLCQLVSRRTLSCLIHTSPQKFHQTFHQNSDRTLTHIWQGCKIGNALTEDTGSYFEGNAALNWLS